MNDDKNPAKATLMVVDDDVMLLDAWKEAFGKRYDLKLFSDGLAASQFVDKNDVDVAMLDVRMPSMDGLTLLQQIKAKQPATEVIMVTGHGTIDMAVQAIQLGAYDFCCKPIDDLDAAVRRIESALERRRLRQLNANLQQCLSGFKRQDDLVGESRAICRLRELITQIADSTAPILICGESGTGKEVAARAIHRASKRHDHPFVAINCAAIPDTLIDSELFGHERGAFTGAVANHRGVFEAANGGTLLLDEIGDMPAQTQVRLLRTLQEREIRSVGSSVSRAIDVHVMCATKANLEQAMQTGRFRDDLYFRISTFRLDLPPLRERREDIPLIARHLLTKLAAQSGQQPPAFDDKTLEMLMQYDWPGNIRELGNALEHAITLSSGQTIEPAHLPSFLAAQPARARQTPAPDEIGSAAMVAYATARDRASDEFEVRYFTDVLRLAQGNLSEAARIAHMDRSNLRKIAQKHHLVADSFRPVSDKPV